MTQKKKNVIGFIVVAIVILLLLCGLFGLDYYRKKTVDILNADMLQVTSEINSQNLTNSQLDKSISELNNIASNSMVNPNTKAQAQMFVAIAKVKEQLNDLGIESNRLKVNFNKAVKEGNKDNINKAMSAIWRFSYDTTSENSKVLVSIKDLQVYGNFTYNKKVLINTYIQPLFNDVNAYLKTIGEFN